MSRIRIYIKPFDTSGNYTEYMEVTKYVHASSISSIKRSIDSTDYDVGVIKINNFSIKLNNQDGLFSDVGELRTIFSYKRSDSLVKIVWDVNDFEQYAGSLTASQGILTEPGGVVVFEGMINDEGTTQGISDQALSFKCFGFEYLLSRIIVPFSSISIGDTMEELIFTMVNQSPFNDLVAVDIANIEVGNNVTVDSIEDLENEIVWDSLSDILLSANAVLYIENNVLIVSPRAASVANEYTFFGQASNNGTENIEDITNFRNGLNRVFNLWKWDDTSLSSLDNTSVELYGARSNSLDLALITNNTSRQTILDGLKTEFFDKKREMVILCKINHERLALKILDKVNIDYPTITYSGDGEVIPVYGVAVYGDARYPLDEFAFSISPLDSFKIIGINYNIKKERIEFRLREV